MQANTLKWILPFVALGIGIAGFMGINAVAKGDEESDVVDTRPIVEVEALQARDHQVVINSYGEVQPLEQTMLSVQVSGEIDYWHPNFVAGGVISKGDVLLKIETDNYQAAVLQAEAALSSAQAQLIEEQALADVAVDEAKRFPNKKHTDLFLRKPQLLSAKAAVKSAQAALSRAQRDLGNCEVVSPFNALVVSRDVGLGQYVNTGAAVARLNNIEQAEIIIPIAGFDSIFLPENVSGIEATLSQKGINGFTRQASIHRDLGVVDQQTRMNNLVVRIDDPYGLTNNAPAIKFGTYVQVQFAGKTLRQIYRLPQELVNNQTVWLLNSDAELEPRAVQVIREEGAYYLVGEGLSNSDTVVVTLPEYPQRGMAVKVAGSEQGKEESDNVGKL
ncbi:efflux RND transporter periplasmic adaptor subunit [Pseudoalteromonas luteoviolacea]|uniref:Membrane protein n=1 Tax=Pseudoalteromonas luteoviolacea NCIMB 1942 TaxID=1365253 RepID=A0A166ZFB6_9GAMM|nr:efflux RND transporter periplasmic adaptor subunit [Pseudoalteromonas luteoviolacea]KZN44256.1 membrane protein [Pseudoalteromonas luteoviolacea NCIMB 1942]KZW99358.1 membrane protein [Pseudoalteromonas luteoviolacea]